MDVRRLQAFCKVYTLRSFSRAADELLLSQPTISAHILALEEELGAQLFDRLGRSVLPTQAGAILFRYAQDIFTRLDHARADILALSQRVSGELILGGSSIPTHYIIPRLLARFLRTYPEVRLELKEGDSRGISELVLDGEIDVGMVGAPTKHPDLVCRPLLDDALVLVAPVAMDVPDLRTKDWRQRLVRLPWVLRESGSGTRQAFARALGRVGLNIRDLPSVLSVHSSMAVLECVEAGLGVSVVSQLAASAYLQRGTVALLTVPECTMTRQFYTLVHAKRYQFPALRAFLDTCVTLATKKNPALPQQDGIDGASPQGD